MYEELLKRALDGDKSAGKKLLCVARQMAFDNKDSVARDWWYETISYFHNISCHGKTKRTGLRDPAEKCDESAALKLFDLAWDAEYNPDTEGHLEAALKLLHSIATYKRDSDDDKKFPQEQYRDDLPVT